MSIALAVFGASLVSLTFVVAGGLAWPHRAKPGVSPFVVTTVSLATVPVPMALAWTGYTEQVYGFLFGAFTVAEVAWVVLAFEYTGRGPTMTKDRLRAVAAFVIVTVLGVQVFPFVPEYALPALLTLNSILQVTLFAAIAYGLFLVVRSWIREELSAGDTLVLGAAGGGLTVAFLVRVLTPQLPRQPMQGPQLLLLGAVGVGIVVGQRRYRVFERGPSTGHLAREQIFDDVGGAVFITDRADRVIDCNRTAVGTFGFEREAVLGRELDNVLGTDPEAADQPVTLNTMRGHRQFEIRSPTLTNARGEEIGEAYLLRDVTEVQTHEQRLDVLNRVLRHNLRNDLDAIEAFAETLADSGAGDGKQAATFAARIENTAEELAELGETVRRAERLLARDQIERERVDLVALAHLLVDEMERRHPAATVTVDAAEPRTTVRTDRLLLEAALEEVLQNAVEHNDEDVPRVAITIEEDETGTRIAVADNGPGIPSREREVLLDGEETPLRHGSGLGLWLVHWCLARLGGDLDLANNRPRGTVVTFLLPGTVTDSAPGTDRQSSTPERPWTSTRERP